MIIGKRRQAEAMARKGRRVAAVAMRRLARRLKAVAMAAARATIETLRDEGGIQRMEAMGTRLRDGLDQQARSLGLQIYQSGPPAIPFLTFVGDPTFEKNRVFCGACARRGVFFHPHHNWFLSAAHGEKDIDEALNVTEAAFKVVKERYGV